MVWRRRVQCCGGGGYNVVEGAGRVVWECGYYSVEEAIIVL